LANLPQFDRNAVDDVSVAGAWERLVEHIESFVVMAVSMGRALVSLVLIVPDQSMGCNDWWQVHRLCMRWAPGCDKSVGKRMSSLSSRHNSPLAASDL
jgi:hypothetical protein